MGNLNMAASGKKKDLGLSGNEDVHLHFHVDKSLGEMLEKMRISMTVNEVMVILKSIRFKRSLDNCLSRYFF